MLFGWDPTPGVVSVWASLDGRALVWRRTVEGALVLEEERFRSWILSSRDDLRHVGAHTLSIEELSGPGELRFLVRADDGRARGPRGRVAPPRPTRGHLLRVRAQSPSKE